MSKYAGTLGGSDHDMSVLYFHGTEYSCKHCGCQTLHIFPGNKRSKPGETRRFRCLECKEEWPIPLSRRGRCYASRCGEFKKISKYVYQCECGRVWYEVDLTTKYKKKTLIKDIRKSPERWVYFIKNMSDDKALRLYEDIFGNEGV